MIVEHTDDDRCENRQDDKQHHYADHTRCLHAESKQRGTSWAGRLLRGGHSRGAPTKLVNAVGELREYALDAFMLETKERSASRRTIRR